MLSTSSLHTPLPSTQEESNCKLKQALVSSVVVSGQQMSYDHLLTKFLVSPSVALRPHSILLTQSTKRTEVTECKVRSFAAHYTSRFNGLGESVRRI